MHIIYNSILPAGRRYSAINIMGVLFVKHGVRLTPELLNHEAIHTAQMREMLYLPFYLLYVLEWLLRLLQTRGKTFEAYRRISFEREAYAHGSDLCYLTRRRRFAQYRRTI